MQEPVDTCLPAYPTKNFICVLCNSIMPWHNQERFFRHLPESTCIDSKCCNLNTYIAWDLLVMKLKPWWERWQRCAECGRQCAECGRQCAECGRQCAGPIKYENYKYAINSMLITAKCFGSNNKENDVGQYRGIISWYFSRCWTIFHGSWKMIRKSVWTN